MKKENTLFYIYLGKNDKHTRIYTYIHTYTHTYIHTYIHKYTHIHTNIYIYIDTNLDIASVDRRLIVGEDISPILISDAARRVVADKCKGHGLKQTKE